jgi:tRNA modification GTPase TrmE
VATAAGESAVAVVRISGPQAVTVVSPLIRSRAPLGAARAHQMHRVTLVDPRSQRAIDDALCTVMYAPRSYTGEDTVELSCHGGPALVRMVLDRLLDQGARLAEPGEFTRRAFLNGKLDLAQAEAVALMIGARTERGVLLAARSIGGELSRRIHGLRSKLLDAVASLEASLDFPDDEPNITTGNLDKEIRYLHNESETILASAQRGFTAHAGLTIAIVGPPNAGKSSLFNAIVGRERAIVSPEAGTTRDVVEATTEIAGVPVKLLDTAGLGVPRDGIDAEGMRRSRDAIDESDALLVVLDGSEPLAGEALRILEQTRDRHRIVVLSKLDLVVEQPCRFTADDPTTWAQFLEGSVRASVKTIDGMANLVARLAEDVMARAGSDGDEGGLIASLRQLELLREYVELLALPNVASDEAGIRRNAAHIVRMLERRGVAARLLDGEGGPPLVYGELSVGAPRTVVFYVHYDGQPVEPERWTSPPWTPVLRDGPLRPGAKTLDLGSLKGPLDGEWRIFARSASDDKAPILAILAALDALKAVGARPSVNLKLLFEGEEEAGSPHLAAVLAKNRELLKADAWLLCDGPVHQSRRMQVVFGVRGVTDVEITVYGPARAVHSGHYGNWVPNPAVALAHLVAGLRDPDGRIAVPGFYDDVQPPTRAERAALAAVPDADAAIRQDLALQATEASGARLVERLMLPALNVRGLQSGAVGARAQNAIPTEARASIDFRLVPDQTPEKVRERVEAHLRAQGWSIVHSEPSLDARRATPNLVRLDTRILAENNNDPAFNFEPVPKRDTNNWSPRIGFNYRFKERSGPIRVFTGRGQLVLRGGYSRSYDSSFNQIFQNVAAGFPFALNYRLAANSRNAFTTFQAVRSGQLVPAPYKTRSLTTASARSTFDFGQNRQAGVACLDLAKRWPVSNRNEAPLCHANDSARSRHR